MTFSVVVSVPGSVSGRGLLGAASASRSLAVGHSVPAVLPGVGAVVSQSWTNRALRGLGLAALGRGESPAAYVAALAELDPDLAWRQVGVVDAAGAAASYTGAECAAWAGERRVALPGGVVLAVGNLLAGPEVLDTAVAHIAAGASEVEEPTDLALLLVGALRAGQAEGGDRRGQQSAVVQVAAAGDLAAYRPPDLDVDLRVDDAAEPLVELARLVELRVRSGGLAIRPRTG